MDLKERLSTAIKTCIPMLVLLSFLCDCFCQETGSFSFSGFVETTAGEAVSGVTVTFSLSGGAGSVPGAVVSDDEGRLSQSGFSAGEEYIAQPSKAGWLFGPSFLEFSEETEGAVFIGRPPFAVAGEVQDETGQPVPGIRISFSLVVGQGEVPPAVTTDDDGDFSQDGFTNGAVYEALPEKSGCRFSPEKRSVSVENGEELLAFTVLMPYSASGKVVDESGNGVAGATIAFTLLSGEGGTPSSVTTLADGSWSQDAFSPGCAYRVVPTKALWSFVPADIELSSTSCTGLLFKGTAPYSVSGKVTDSSGAPVPNVKITFALMSGTGAPPSAVYTSGEGVFSQSGFAGGSGFRAVPRKDQWVFAPTSRDFSSATSGLNFSGGGPFSISGQVTDPNGSGVAGVIIQFTRLSGSGVLPVAAETAGDGAFSQSGFSSGTTYRAAPEKKGWHFDPSYLEFSDTVADARFTGVPPYSVSGRILDKSGKGVPGVQITFSTAGGGSSVPTPVLTGPDGRWSQAGFEGAQRYTASPSLTAWAFDPRIVEFSEANNELDFLAAGPYSVSGRIIDEQGKGVAGVVITFSLRNGTGVVPDPVTTNADGGWLQKGFWGGCEYGAIPWKTGWGFVPRFRLFREISEEVDFVGEGSYSVSGAVTDEAGDPVEGVTISFVAADRTSGFMPAVLTGTDGSWSQTGFPGGVVYRAIPSKKDWAFEPGFREVERAAQGQDFVGIGPYSACGRVVDESGNPVGGVRITFTLTQGNGSRPAAVVTDQDGYWCQEGFAGGATYVATPTKTSWTFKPGSRSFGEQASGQDFVASGPYSASGRVVDESGSGVTGVKITFRLNSGNGSVPSPVETDSDGYWHQSGFASEVAYSATPSKTSWTFTPGSRVFSEETAGQDFVASGPYVVSGRIVDTSGQPVAGVTVIFTIVSGSGVIPERVITDDEGRWQQSGFASRVKYRATPSMQSWVFSPNYLEFDDDAAGQDFVGTPPYAVSGKVVAESGEGLQGVKVSFSRKSGSAYVPQASVTDDGGNWRVSGFSVGTPYVVTFSMDGWAFNPSSVEFSAARDDIVVVGLGPYPVSGKVVDTQGNPVAGVKIVFSPRTGTRRAPPSTVTEPDGSWSQEGFGRNYVYRAIPVVTGWSFTPSYREFREPSADLNFEGEGPFDVAGKVVDRMGRGVEGVKILFSSSNRGGVPPDAVITSADGSFRQKGFWAGSRYTARPEKAGWGFVPDRQEFTSNTILVFTAREPYGVSGRVVDRSGKGISDLLITFSTDSNTNYRPDTVRTAGDGSFSQSGFCGATTYRAIPQREEWTFTPAFREFDDASDSLNFEGREPEVVVTVSSEYGTPVPACGDHIIIKGSTVDASVNAIVSGEEGTRQVCTGWKGTGSVPESGSDAWFSFQAQKDSSITWLWATEYKLSASAYPAQGGTVRLPQGEWFRPGEKATCSCSPNGEYIFVGWFGDARGRAASVTVTMDGPKQVTAMFSLDADEDGLPDEWEKLYFGDLSEDGFGDPDQDDVPNSVEYYFDTDPSEATPKLTAIMTECGINVTIEFPDIQNKVSVLETNGQSVTGLTSTDFVMWEDNVWQAPLEVAEKGGTDAVSVALVLDNSGSMDGQPLEDSHAAANLFVDQLKSQDSAAVVKFGMTVSLVQQFTSDKTALHSAVDGSFDGYGGTSFYSAIYRALHECIPVSGNRAVIALTDGIDNTSNHGIQQVIDYARRIGIPVYVIGLGRVAEDALINIAESTGGAYYYAPSSSELQAIYDEISRIAGNWYNVDYVTSNSDPNAPPYPRTVTVWAHSNGAIGRAQRQYEPPRENTAPLCHADTPQGVQAGDVAISYQLLDFESDLCSVETFYSIDGGWTWSPASISAECQTEDLGSSPGGVAHSLVWLSRQDLPGADEDRVQIRIVPYDSKKGTPAETSEFSVRNNTRPRAEVDTPVGPQHGDIPISYSLIDADGDACSIAVSFSLDGGVQWQKATMASGGDGTEELSSSADGVEHAFVWDSVEDVGLALQGAVRIRIAPSDKASGTPGDTQGFAVNNVPPAELSYAPESLSFTAHEGEGNPEAKVLEIWNSGEGILSWQLQSDSPWLIISPNNGQSSGERKEVTVQVDISGLSMGTYKGEIRIAISSDAPASITIVPVTLTVEEPLAVLVVTPQSLTFSAVLSEGGPAQQTVQVRNAGGGDMAWQAWVSAAWLSLTPDQGSSAGETDALSVIPSLTGLIPGKYKATITIVAPKASNTPKLISVTLTVAESYPEIAVQPESLLFTAEQDGQDPPSQIIQIWNAGGLTLPWQAQGSQAWLTVSPTSGSSAGNKNNVTVSVKIAGLSPGTHTGLVTVSSESALNSPVAVPVELIIMPAVADITVSPSYLVFTTGKGGPGPPAQEITISTNGALNWRADYSAGWLRVNPSEGTLVSGSCRVKVAAIKSGLGTGAYEAKITLASTDHSDVQEMVSVTLNIRPIEIPTDYPTIQQGIQAAYDDDTIIVLPGTYRENVSVNKNVEVRSSSGMDVTTIDGSGLGAVVSFEDVDAARLEGFTLINGTGNDAERLSPAGGGIYCLDSSPVIAQCQVIGNSAAWGGGICVDGESSPEIVDTLIMGNVADDGGGIFCYENASPRFVTCIIVKNSAYWFGGGACGIEDSSMTFAGNLFHNNVADLSGGGLYATQGCAVRLISCTFVDNSSPEGGNLLAELDSSVTILNSIIWDQPDDLILLGNVDVQYSNTADPKFSNANGNITAEPLFFDPQNGDYHILPDSPCIDNGLNDVSSIPEKDLDGDPRVIAVRGVPATDMGADEHDPEMVFILVTEEVVVGDDCKVTVPYTLWSSLSISCPVTGEYTDDNGRSWHPATPAAPEQVPTGVVSSPSGKQHTFVWDAAADLGSDFEREVRLRLKAEAPKASRPAVTDPFWINPGI